MTRITVGRISGVFGILGWVKVYSYTSPRQGIINYSAWRLASGGQAIEFPAFDASRLRGSTIIARFRGIDDRDAAAALVGCDITVDASQLESLGEGEYYCHELIGLKVIASGGCLLGAVSGFIETGANDVMVVEQRGERHLIPYAPGEYVEDVDLKSGCVRVHWKREWSR